MTLDELEALAQRFSGDFERAIRRLANRVQENPCPIVEAFLRDLNRCIDNIDNDAQLGDFFLDVAERYICSGNPAFPNADLVRIVEAAKFLFYYSKKFIYLEGEQQQEIQDFIAKVRSTLSNIKADDIRYSDKIRNFLEDVLELNGRLRRKGYPLWLTDEYSVRDCQHFKDYLHKLALPDDCRPPFFRFTIILDYSGLFQLVCE
ncbi:hypothetical protein H8E77_00380 [bacterium]|nr:hypothetical protein [bacterium]